MDPQTAMLIAGAIIDDRRTHAARERQLRSARATGWIARRIFGIGPSRGSDR